MANRPFHSSNTPAGRPLETENRRSHVPAPKPRRAFEDRLPDNSEALKMKALSFRNRSPRSKIREADAPTRRGAVTG
jgi:hypothetical protein